MADMNKYWTGQQQAYIPDGWVAADWGSGDGAGNRIRMLNGAFEIYFILKTSIRSCPDSTLRDLMTTELDKAGNAGWGTGVWDMDDAFQHWMKPGKWTDNNLKTYMQASGIFGGLKPSITGAKFCWGLPTNTMPGPAAATSFFNALDDKMADLKSAIGSHNTEVANLKDALEAKNSAKTKDALKSISKYGNIAKKFLFLAPKPDDTFIQDVLTGSPLGVPSRNGSFTRALDVNPPGAFNSSAATTAATPNNTAVLAGVGALTFLTALNDIDTFLTVHKQALDTGIFDNRTATAFAALAVACSRVPILGGFYAEIVKALPNFFGNMNDMFRDHNRKMIALSRSN